MIATNFNSSEEKLKKSIHKVTVMKNYKAWLPYSILLREGNVPRAVDLLLAVSMVRTYVSDHISTDCILCSKINSIAFRTALNDY